MPVLMFWLFLPLRLATNVFFLLWFSLSGHGKAIWRAKLDALCGLAPMLRKRRQIQRNRQASMAAIWRVMERNLLAPLYTSIQRRRFGSD